MNCRSLKVEIKDGEILDLPIASAFVGLGYYPYLPFIEPDKEPDQYGLRKGMDGAFWNKEGQAIRLYVPPGEFYYTRLSSIIKEKSKGAKRRFRKSRISPHVRDAHFAYLMSLDQISGNEICGYRIGDNLYEDVETFMPLKIPDKYMCISL